MKLSLIRKFKGSKYTIGDLSIDGTFFCNTIEDVIRELPDSCPDTSRWIPCKCKEKVYDPAYNDYELSDHEYVVYGGCVFYPETDVNADVPELGNNLSLHDPRNYNLKKHMVRLAVYELTKLIAPNNVSAVRMRDYEDSMKWLNDAAKLRLNPQIPRKVDETKKPVTDWQLATFQNDYDPYRNPWMV